MVTPEIDVEAYPQFRCEFCGAQKVQDAEHSRFCCLKSQLQYESGTLNQY